jgi:hypothetical protein
MSSFWTPIVVSQYLSVAAPDSMLLSCAVPVSRHLHYGE